MTGEKHKISVRIRLQRAGDKTMSEKSTEEMSPPIPEQVPFHTLDPEIRQELSDCLDNYERSKTAEEALLRTAIITMAVVGSGLLGWYFSEAHRSGMETLNGAPTTLLSLWLFSVMGAPMGARLRREIDKRKLDACAKEYLPTCIIRIWGVGVVVKSDGLFQRLKRKLKMK
jgi:hypothetical protein